MKRHTIPKITKSSLFACVLLMFLILNLHDPSSSCGKQERETQRWVNSSSATNLTEPEQCQRISNKTTHESVCHCLAHWVASSRDGSGLIASNLWRTYEETIRQAALESTRTCWWPDMFKKLDLGVFDKFTKDLFAALDIYRLRRSMKTPANPLVMRQVVEIIIKRLVDPGKNPPLKIAVFGGSATYGCWSLTNIYGLDYGGLKCLPECTWTAKLERLVNDALGSEVISVKNYAFGGVDSDIGSILLEYNLWPGEEAGEDFDVIVSAFSSNDAQPPDETVDFLYESWQRFIRLAMDQRPCSQLPLVIQLEDNIMDYFKGDIIHTGLRYSRDMVQTAAWAGIMSVSYADAIRDYVYANTSSQLLTEYRQLHPGQGFHTGVAWTMAWNLLNALIESCDAKALPQESLPHEALPILTTKLKSSEIESLLKESKKKRSELCSSGGRTTGVQCVYKWVASALAASTKQAIATAMKPVLRRNVGWQAIGSKVRQPRRTWLGEGLNSTFTIQLDKLDRPIDKMLVLYVKSYGEIWASSRLLLVVEGLNSTKDGGAFKVLHKAHLDGIHGAQTSINYSHKIDLGDFLQTDSSVRAHFTIVGGSRFQINGLALCQSSQPILDIE